MKNKNLINAISGLLGFTIPIIALIFSSPYIVENLGAESYGIINLTSLLISYLLLLDCAYEVTLTKQIATNKNSINNLASDSLLVYSTIGIIGLILIIILGYPYVFYIVNIDNNKKLDLYLTIICTGFSFLSLMIFTWNRAVTNGINNYISSNIFYIIFNLGGVLVALLIVHLGGDFFEYTFFRTIVWLIMIPIYIFHIHKNIVNLKLNFTLNAFIEFRKNIKYGFWLRLSEQFLNRADQLVITIIFNIETVAYFSACFIIYNANTLLIRKMIEFTLPKFAELNINNEYEKLKKYFEQYFEITTSLVLLIFGISLFVGNDLLNVWLGNDFAQHSNIIYFNMLLGGLISGISIIQLSYLLISTNNYAIYSKYLTIRSVVYLVLFILLSIIFDISIDTISILFIVNGFADHIFMYFIIRNLSNIKLNIFTLKFYSYSFILIIPAITIYLQRSIFDFDYNFANLILMCIIYFSFYIFVSILLNYPNRVLFSSINKLKN